jgi:hypothetical protein
MSTPNRPDEPYLDETSRPGTAARPWWGTPLFAGVLLATVIVGLGVWVVYGLGKTPGMATDAMEGNAMGAETGDVPRIPPVLGYYGGEEVFFIHTEASDEEVAGMLEEMMDSPVPVVPSLADVPDQALSTVYVFTNGMTPADTPAGPLGFQPDVFDAAPGDEGYTPLRRLVQVTWADDAQARLLTSEQDISDAEDAGEVTREGSGIVVNIPLLTWPGGQR